MSTTFRAVLKILLWLGLAILGGATVLGQLGRIHWFFELFAHFPLQIAGGLGVLLALAMMARQWGPAVPIGLALIPNLLALHYYFPAVNRPSAKPNVRVLSFNVLTTNSSFREVENYLASSGADVLFLMEINRTWAAELAPLEAVYPHSVKEPREDNFGMALYSKHPIKSHDLRLVRGSVVPILRAILEVGGRELEVVGAHPVPPVGAIQAAWRNVYLQTLSETVLESDHPKIVLGDFNATVWSPFMRNFLERTHLQDTGRRAGFQSTWMRRNPLFSLPIDHVLHSSELVCTNRQVGPALGSDHRPLVADFAFQ